MVKTQEQRDYEHTIQREIAAMKMEERLENVQRIGRANMHKQLKIKEQIDLRSQKGERDMAEKKKLLENRLKIRQEADAQKRDMMEKVEKMKKTGNFDHNTLASLGINLDNIDKEYS